MQCVFFYYLQQTYKWIDNTPLTYRNIVRNKYSVTLANVFALPNELQPKEFRDMYNQFNHAERIHRNIAPNKFESFTYNKSHCMAISTNLINMGLWLVIDCAKKMDKAWALCEMNNYSTTVDELSNGNRLTTSFTKTVKRELSECPPGMITSEEVMCQMLSSSTDENITTPELLYRHTYTIIS